MDEPWVRLILVAVAAVIVVAVTLATRKWQRPGHPQLDLDEVGFTSGVVMFTSTDCATCKEALAVVRPLDVPFREVTWELEPGVLEKLNVSAVPMTVFVGPSDAVVDQIVGVPKRRRLARAESAWRKAVATAS